ncbi:MAG: tetratricopeptide repeat protein [Acidobacteriota bacterium]
MMSARALLPAAVVLVFAFLSPGLATGAELETIDPFYLKQLDEGLFFYRSGDMAGAVECFRVAAFGLLDDRARLVTCYAYLAVIYHDLKMPEQARRYVYEVTSLKAEALMKPPGFPASLLQSYQTVARLYDQGPVEGEKPKAPAASALRPSADLGSEIDVLRRTIKANPSVAANYFLLSDRLRQQGKLKDAREVLEDLLKRDPKNAEAWLELGRLNFDRHEIEEAAADFRRAVEIEPKDVEGWYWLGSAYMELKQLPQARTALTNGLQLNPDYMDLKQKADRAVTAMSAQHDRAMQLYEEAMAQSAPDARVETLKQALKLDPCEPRVLIALSGVYADLKQYKTAAEQMEACMAVQPDKVELYLRAADLWAQSGEPAKALAALRKVEGLKSSVVEVQYQTGKIYMQQKRYDLAKNELEKIVRTDPSYKDAQRLLDQCVQALAARQPR